VLLGTVRGDIHDIGKNMAAMLLECHGFQVVDLGVDVPADEFAAQAVNLKPTIVGLSGLITASFEAMRETVAVIRRQAAQNGVTYPIVIGGGQLDEQVFRYIGADYWVTDAMNGVRLCQRLVAG
jgi:5-methyltetrahydrofolate--homocysteine methyltransferase